MDIFVDVLIVGTGIAGMYAALNLRKDLKVLLLSKTKVEECNSNLAQGGISVARDYNDIEIFINDTMAAGKYENNMDAVRILAEESKENIDMLINYGVKFDIDENGLKYTREGAHSVNRIVHCKDQTGNKVTETLLKEVRRRKNIMIYEDTCLADILRQGNYCGGGIAIKDDMIINIHSKITIFASGGIGGIFKNSTNTRSLTGDGIAIAIKNDIRVKDLEYIQIHPTVLYEEKIMEKRFLISEAVRGEGGRLVNINGERFVDELLPRDVVSQKIFEEERKTNNPFVGLDISFKSKDFIITRFPGIYSECLKRGIDITREIIPVTPAQHYFMGGIQVDLYSKTSMENLYACGEVSCTGVHGANRLASNSLLEALVFSKRAANDINSRIDTIEMMNIKTDISINNIRMCQENNKRIVVEKFKNILGEMRNELVDN